MNNCIIREKIIMDIKDALEKNTTVYALWLEGSDALGCADEYSDLDFVADVEDGHEEELGNLDLHEKVYVNHPKIKQKIYHIKDTSDYLILDFNIQSHSRKKEESTFVRGDIVEAAHVLFDKCGVVTWKDEDYKVSDHKEEILNRLVDLKSRYQQHSRVIKYIKRNQFLEAYMYFMKYVVDPIIQLLRFKYTPKHDYLYLIHISSHIPERERLLLESFFKVTSVDDIYKNTKQSREIFDEIISDIEELL